MDINKKLVLQIAGIPCANRPYDISLLINGYSNKYQSRHILGSQYSKDFPDIPYREFPYDLLIRENMTEIEQLFKEASIIHIHHKLPRILKKLITKKHKVVYTVSNIGSSTIVNDCEINKEFYESIQNIADIITVTDQPLQKKVYSNLTTRTLPLVKYLFNEKIEKNTWCLVIAFAPTNRRKDNVTSKGYYEVLNIIKGLYIGEYAPFLFDLIEGEPYEENLNRKRKADILIDDVVNENFHNSSIEMACFEGISLTNYSDANYPFLKTNIDTLEDTLIKLLTDRNFFENQIETIKHWKKYTYTPEKLVKCYDDIYDEVLTK